MSDERNDAAPGSNDPGDSVGTPTDASGAGGAGTTNGGTANGGVAADGAAGEGSTTADAAKFTGSGDPDRSATDRAVGGDQSVPDAAGGSTAGAPAQPTGKRRTGAVAARPRGPRPAAPGSKAEHGRSTPRRAVAEAPSKGSPVARLTRFLREVVAELRKVIWPTRKQLVTYTVVVLVFVSFMVALVSGLDIAFARGVLLIFG